MEFEKHPISRVEWLDVNLLRSNSYNPNIVQAPELALLKYSLMAQGWIQPILVSKDPDTGEYEIIDGYHRFSLAKTDKDIFSLTGGKVPVVVMSLTVPERMLLTIRINRAKGSHMAFKMHEIVHALVYKHGLTKEAVAEAIGAASFEVETLLMENVFQQKQVDRLPYSRSWVPVKAAKPKKGAPVSEEAQP